ncbi:hypothetical protein [Arcobacter ellisii]|uniref:Membrane protein n=1 Tax=Arcobacter ellisii TaxID=913109 RepID=A0A347UB36_9BACT|nr:hypothetical protein [Arcobacter ellisii]AXX96064.1 putative membrane protein [Arcobacter ellisii]RXI28929.1 hypothetical protein CP962_12670 [Arcobacter ellisii]
MANKKIKWFIYTVLVGMIPIISRLLITSIINKEDVTFFVATDFIALGLVLHISIINELEHVKNDINWKTIQNGMSIVYIAAYSVLFCLGILNDEIPNMIDKSILLKLSVILVVTSFFLSSSVFHRVNAIYLKDSNV